MGPLPGLILAAFLGLTGLPHTHPWVETLGRSLVVVNLLNVLPLAVLDGGRLLRRVLLSRHPLLELLGDLVMGWVGTAPVEAISWSGAPRKGAGDGDVEAWAPPILKAFVHTVEGEHKTWTETARRAGPCFREYPGLLVTGTLASSTGTWSLRKCFFVTPSASYVFETRIPLDREATALPDFERVLDATELK